MRVGFLAFITFIILIEIQTLHGQLNTYKNVIQNDGDSDQMSFYNQFRDEWKKWIPAQQEPRKAEYTGTWFPHNPNESDMNPTVDYNTLVHDDKHGAPMGVTNPSCDDAKTNLTIDWDMSSENYTCFENRHDYAPRTDLSSLRTEYHIPKYYIAYHECMNASINYNDVIPTFGTHRPLWAKYGEYKFLPRQRWMHNLEHGAVVMLYHPCADRNQVNLLRKIVKNCLFRHVITPYNMLSKERPIALVTWGVLLEMPEVNPEIAIEFIKRHALKGPEDISRDGQYDLLLSEPAELINGKEDGNVCDMYSEIYHMK